MEALPLLVRKLWPRLKFFKSRSNFKVKVTRSKILGSVERSCIRNVHNVIWKPYLFWLGLWLRLKFFFKVGQTSSWRLLGQKFWYPWKGLSQGMYIWNMEALPPLVRKLWPRLKFFKSRSNFKVNVTQCWYPWKGLDTRNTHVKYESSTYSSSWVIGKVKVFVHADMDAHADARGTTIALQTFVPAS